MALHLQCKRSKRQGKKASNPAEYLDYGPADSGSSMADFSDSEPDSQDDAFIEHDGHFFPGLAIC